MSWCALDVKSPPETRDAVATWLVARTGQAVEERGDGILVSFATSEVEAGSLLGALRSAFGGVVAGTSRLLPDVDWTRQWRDGLGPRVIGRLIVTPSWAVPEDAGSCTVVIDPETAFGTGEHGSTRAALTLLDRHITSGSRVLDFGSGSGILAIAAAKLGAARATGIELDPEVEPIAAANVARNGVEDRVTCLTGDAAALAPLLAPADLILSNILRSVNETLLPLILRSLARGGVAIFAGMERAERSGFIAALARAGFVPIDEAADGDWWGVAVRAA
jgi:ribosomal protein L11 methyltransferase